MFAGTLGRSQFFVRSCLVSLVEAALLFACIAIQHEAFAGPPGQGRHQLATSAFAISAVFAFLRIGFAIRRNRDAGGGDMLPGIYAFCICGALALQTQALIARTLGDSLNGVAYAMPLQLVLGSLWFRLLLRPSAPGAAKEQPAPSFFRHRSDNEPAAGAPSRLSLAMDQVIAGTKQVPAAPAAAATPALARQPMPTPRARTEFGRRGVR